MRVLRLLVALSFASLLAHEAVAQTDPNIGFGGLTGSLTPSCGVTVVIGENETACGLSGVTVTASLSNDETGGTVDLNNDTSTDVMSMTITDTNLPAGETISCSNTSIPFFSSAEQTAAENGCIFSGNPDDFPSGASGGIVLTGFDKNSTIDLTVTAPEPSSLLLLGIGVLPKCALRKGRRRMKCEA